MTRDLRGVALEKAELLSGHLKGLLSSGQRYVRDQLGVDLGLNPDAYPTWVILSTAAVGLLLLLRLSWAAVVGKKRGSPDPRSTGEPGKAQTAKPEEQRKKNKKKPLEKNTQSNGQPVAAAQEPVKVKATDVVPKPAPQIKTEKVHEVQAPEQVKKNKKKTKTIVKPVQHVSPNDGKETDDAGDWETKVSNREKKQQRRKDKGPEDSGSPGSVTAPKGNAETPVASAHVNTKKNRGNPESLQSRSAGKSETASRAVSSARREEPSVNGGGWTDVSRQTGSVEGTKWSGVPPAAQYRPPPKPQSWGQETQAWSGIDGRKKADINPGAFSMLGLNTTETTSNPMEWAKRPDVDDEWSGYNGKAAADPSCDWNAPEEHWGNYEEPPVLVTAAPLLKDQPVPNKVSEDEKDVEDPSGGGDKSKKKRKKKQKTEEDAASEVQTVSMVPPVKAKPQEPPVPATKKPNPSRSPSQKKSEPAVEPPKPSQKKKVRRET
ncbi:metadherin a isoform X1 [Pungitius pungitius]|uniref:metadherin a isoform X1 n=1 Tax=Pungitius pungitius TaxID=134920 RepID=UPI002E13CA49